MGTIKLIAVLLLVAGIVLIAFSIYMYVKKDIRTIEKDLKSTKKVAAEKKEEDSLASDFYYKTEAEQVMSTAPVQPKGFRRQQERPARNDTGLLRSNNPKMRNNKQTAPLSNKEQAVYKKEKKTGRFTLPLE